MAICSGSVHNELKGSVLPTVTREFVYKNF